VTDKKTGTSYRRSSDITSPTLLDDDDDDSDEMEETTNKSSVVKRDFSKVCVCVRVCVMCALGVSL